MEYQTNCVNAVGFDIQEMVDKSEEITLTTFRKYAGGLEELEKSMGYDTGHERGGLRLSNDWAVSFYRSQYKGRPCVFMVHSAIEYIWT